MKKFFKTIKYILVFLLGTVAVIVGGLVAYVVLELKLDPPVTDIPDGQSIVFDINQKRKNIHVDVKIEGDMWWRKIFTSIDTGRALT